MGGELPWSPISALRDSEAAAERQQSNKEQPGVEEIRNRLKKAFRDRRIELTPSDYRTVGLAAKELHDMELNRLQLKRWLNGLARQPVEAVRKEVRYLAKQYQR